LEGAHQMRADVRELALAALVQTRDRIPGEHYSKVALAGLVDRGARAVGEVATAESERRYLQLTQVILQGRAVERAPAGLVHRHLAWANGLDPAREQQVRVERQISVGQQLPGELRTRAAGSQDGGAILDGAPTAEVDIDAIGLIQPD